jgi:hypothetical protein
MFSDRQEQNIIAFHQNLDAFITASSEDQAGVDISTQCTSNQIGSRYRR